MRPLLTLVALVPVLAGSAARGQEASLADLFAAIEKKDAAAVREILSKAPHLASARDAEGQTAVGKALFRNDGGIFVPREKNDVLKAVLDARPSLSFLEACGLGEADRVRSDLARDPRLAVSWNASGWSALHLAAFSGSAETAALLLERGAAIDARARTRFRNTPLQAAILGGRYETAKLLLERGADPLVRQAKGFAPIHEAAFRGRRDLVELLLAHGAEATSRADDGRTALDEALRGGSEPLAELLRSKGASAGAKP